MPISYVQSNTSFYAASGSGGDLPCAYDISNTIGNIGIAWLTADKGAGPSGCTDSQGNTWRSFGGYFTNSGYATLFVCTKLKGGTNTVTVHGVVASTSPSIGPELTVLELAPPCGGIAGIQALRGGLALNGVLGGFGGISPLTFQGFLGNSAGQYFNNLLVFLNMPSYAPNGTLYSWAIVGSEGTSALLTSWEDTGTLQVGVVGLSITENDPYNYITFGYSPSSPAPSTSGGSATIMLGLLINTLS